MASTTVGDLEVLARLLNLPIPHEHRASVLAQFERLQAIAASLDAFPLPPEVEPATVFSNDRP